MYNSKNHPIWGGGEGSWWDPPLGGGPGTRAPWAHPLIRACLYTDSSFYSAIGQEFCLVFDIFYVKSGTEAVAESFYRVVEKQEMEGGQTISVLMNRAKIDWCLPSVIQCDSAITEMAKIQYSSEITENASGTRSICFPFAFYLRSICVPFAFRIHWNAVRNAFQ